MADLSVVRRSSDVQAELKWIGEKHDAVLGMLAEKTQELHDMTRERDALVQRVRELEMDNAWLSRGRRNRA